jgi:hypothetical protein
MEAAKICSPKYAKDRRLLPVMKANVNKHNYRSQNPDLKMVIANEDIGAQKERNIGN